MLRLHIAAVCLVMTGLAGAAPFQYHEGFETKDPVKLWVSNGTADVHFKGLSDEAAHSGRRSFKLDVTLRKGTYFYWHIPMRVAVAGSLTLSAWVKMVPPTNASIGVGANYQFPPTRHSGCGPVERFRTTKGEWRQMSVGLDQLGWAPLTPSSASRWRAV